MISVLNVASRPTVYFQAGDKNHRRYFARFLRDRSWGNCPVQFYLEHSYSDVPAMIQDKIASYYLSREFRDGVPTLDRSWITECRGSRG